VACGTGQAPISDTVFNFKSVTSHKQVNRIFLIKYNMLCTKGMFKRLKPEYGRIRQIFRG